MQSLVYKRITILCMIAHRKSATPQKKKLTAQQQHKGCLKKRVFMFEKSILMEISVERGNEKSMMLFGQCAILFRSLEEISLEKTWKSYLLFMLQRLNSKSLHLRRNKFRFELKCRFFHESHLSYVYTKRWKFQFNQFMLHPYGFE